MNTPVQHTDSATSPENRLAIVLGWFALAGLIIAVILLLIPYFLPSTDFFVATPFFVTNTIAGVLLLSMTAWLASGDVRRFRLLVTIVALGLLVGATAMLGLYLSPIAGDQQGALLIGFGIYSVLALVLAFLSWQAIPQTPSWKPWIPEKDITRWERVGQVVYGGFGIFSVIAVIGSIAMAFDPKNPLITLWVQPVFVAGSAVKIGVLGMLSLAVALKIRHRLKLITVVIVGHGGSWVVISILAILGYGRFGDFTISFGTTTIGVSDMMLGAWLLDVVIVAVFGFIQMRINASVIDHLNFFSTFHFRVLEPLVETLIEGSEFERIPPYQCALNTDGYLSSFNSRRLFLAKLTLMGVEYLPLVWLRQPITFLSPSKRRDFIDKRFKQEIINLTPGYRLMNGLLRFVNRILLTLRGREVEEELNATMNFTDLLEGMMRFVMQMSYLGYYGDERSWTKDDKGNGIGYVPFSKRSKNFKAIPRRPHPPLEITTPEDVARQGLDVIVDADVVIIGSGAAGAVLAEQLLAQGRRVLMLERGVYSHPDTFNEDELDMVSRLYSDGALQISQSLRFTILQGSAVGGTTVVNNAVCFDTPKKVINNWNARNASKTIDVEEFYLSQKAIRERLQIGRIKAGTRTPLDDVLNHGDVKITDGVSKYFANHPELGQYDYDVVEANITDCLGCGYCNIGCKYGRKISMLDEVLPKAQAEYGADKFQIFSEAEVTHLEANGKQISEVVATIRGKRRLVIKNPKTVIVSAGTIASSWLLKKSKIGENLPVGRGLSFNMGSPLYGWFDEPVNSFQGLQIAHYLNIKEKEGFVYETWYNPPLAQALTMPGWLDTHYQNMQRYDEMAAIGVLVGTESNAHIQPALLVNGPDVVYKPTQRDMGRLLDALQILGGILFEAGAKEVYASTRKYHSYKASTGKGNAHLTSLDDLVNLRELVKDDSDLLLGTGHPQGGNAIGSRPDGANPSVIDGNFKVYGYDNLYVCDASVHPTSTTVNPQLTVMSLAHYASKFIE